MIDMRKVIESFGVFYFKLIGHGIDYTRGVSSSGDFTRFQHIGESALLGWSPARWMGVPTAKPVASAAAWLITP